MHFVLYRFLRILEVTSFLRILILLSKPPHYSRSIIVGEPRGIRGNRKSLSTISNHRDRTFSGQNEIVAWAGVNQPLFGLNVTDSAGQSMHQERGNRQLLE